MGNERTFGECPNYAGVKAIWLKALAAFVAAILALVFAFAFAPASAFADEGIGSAGNAASGIGSAASDAFACEIASAASSNATSNAAILSPSETIQLPNLTLYGLDGTIRTLPNDYAGEKLVVLCGRPACWNTANTVEDMLFAQENGYEDVRLVVLDIDNDPDTFLSGFGDLHCDAAYFASSETANYASWAFSLLRKIDPSASGSVTLPFAFIVDENGTVLAGSTGFFDVFEALETAYSGEGSVPVTGPAVNLDLLVNVSVDQAEARKVLALVNEARSAVGKSALKWDEELEKAAMQRAAELVLLFEHTRPDGTGCYTAFPPYGYAGENIAYGYWSAESVNLGWTNSPGHYSNMINGNFKSMAVGCVTYNGRTYWTELFTDRAGSTTLGEPVVSDSKDFVVTKKSKDFLLNLSGTGDLNVGDEAYFVDYVMTEDGFHLATSNSLAWASSNPSALYVDPYGEATALAPGTAKITVSLAANPNVSDSVTITVKGQENNPVRIAPPVANMGLIYDGSLHVGVPAGEGYVLSGDYLATEPGEYEAIATLLTGYIWNDGTTASKVIKWSIGLPVAYDVKAIALPAEGGIVLGAGRYVEGETAVLKTAANDGYLFAGWMEDGVWVHMSSTYAFEVTCDRDLVAIFEALEPEPDPGDPDPEPGDPEPGDPEPGDPNPEPGPSPEPGPTPEPSTCTVSLFASPEEGGIVVGGGTFAKGETITIAAVPNDGYEFAGWAEDGVLVSTFAAYTFEVSADRFFVALFKVAEPEPGPSPEPGPNPDPEPPYSDLWRSFPDVKREVEGAGGPDKVWYVADGWLDYVVNAGLMGGYASNGWFGTYDNITRGQVAVILYRAECAKDPSLIEKYGSTTDPAKYAWLSYFRDEERSVYYTAAINWAKDAGIMTGDAGTGYTTVRPNDPVARQELCLMLARYANDGVVPSVQLDPFKAQGIFGMDKIADWARDGVYWAVNNDVIGGVSNGDGTFSMNPAGKTWRSAAAKMFTVVMRDILS